LTLAFISKIKQAFSTSPVITDLGNGNQLVTVNGQSFFNKNNEDKPLSVAQQKQNRELFYYDLLINASKIGLEQLKNLHPQAFEELQKLHLSFGKTNPFTNMVIPLAILFLHFRNYQHLILLPRVLLVE
jgi:hypothetical protein